MFRNRVAQVKFVKEQKPDEVDGERNIFEGPEVAAAYAEIAKDLITHAALTIGGVFIACKIVGRICK
jgi:hypothetical protein